MMSPLVYCSSSMGDENQRQSDATILLFTDVGAYLIREINKHKNGYYLIFLYNNNDEMNNESRPECGKTLWRSDPFR